MRDADDQPRAQGGLPPGTAWAAAQMLDLNRSRRIVYAGGEGDTLAAFPADWPQLTGVWFGPVDAQRAAQQFLARRGLADRIRHVDGDVLAAG